MDHERMKNHAGAILEAAGGLCGCLEASDLSSSSTPIATELKAITPTLLQCFISESASLGGSLLDRFWEVMGMCDPQLKENITQLGQTEILDREHSARLLFQGLNKETVNFDSVFRLAEEIFTHLGVVMMNPRGRISMNDMPTSVDEEMALASVEELLQHAAEPGFGERKQSALKALAFERDGGRCLLTDILFGRPPIVNIPPGIVTQTAYILPNMVREKPDTLRALSRFAGVRTVDLVRNLDTVGNVMNLEFNALTFYDRLCWGIEARKENEQIVYIYRSIPSTAPSWQLVKHSDGDQIMFGVKEKLPGPDPLLCNIQLAVARALKMSGAAELLERLNDEADISNYPHNYIASDVFADILASKLLLSGSASLL